MHTDRLPETHAEENNTLQDRFRLELTNVHAATVAIVSLFEIIGYVILVLSDVEQLSARNPYLWYGVVLPIAVNAVTHLTARRIVNHPSVSRRRKNTAIIVAALITALVVAVIHKEYAVTACAFIFPILLSTMFHDRGLLNVSFVGTLVILAAVGAAFLLDGAITLTTSINLLVLLGFSIISFLCSIIAINHTEDTFETIEEQAEENDKLLQDILHDSKTGLFNYTAFVAHLDSRIRAYRKGVPLCLAMVDGDNFKSINDTYGHACGDEVLIYLGATLQDCCTEEDTAYRYGGEEFAVVFVGKTPEEAREALNRALETFRSHVFSFADHPITFSAGVAVYTAGSTRDKLFRKADKTLYTAKRRGKNHILIAK